MSEPPASPSIPKRKRWSIGTVALLVAIVLLAVVGGLLSWEGRRRTAVAEPWAALQIVVTWPGASTEVMDETVAVPLEDAVAGVPGVQHVLTRSREGETVVTLYLRPGTDVDSVFHETASAVLEARPQLPHDIDEPQMSKFSGHVEPVVWLALFSPGGLHTESYLGNCVEQEFKPRLMRQPGIGGIEISGAPTETLCVLPDRDRLAAHQLTTADIHRVLREQHIDLNDRAWQQYALKRRFITDDLGAVVLKKEDVLLRDVATVEFCYSHDSFARLDGKRSIALGVRPGVGVTAKQLRERLHQMNDDLAAHLPEGLDYEVVIDLSRTVIDGPTSFSRNKPRAFSNPNAAVMVLDVQLPDGASLERTEESVSRIEAILQEIPGVKHVLANANEATSNRARVFVQLGTSGDSYAAIGARIRESMTKRIPEASVYLSDPSGASLPPMHRQPVTLLFQGPVAQERGRLADEVLQALRKESWFVDGNMDFSAFVPHLEIRPDRTKLAALGISAEQFNDAIAEFTDPRSIKGKQGLIGPVRVQNPFRNPFRLDGPRELRIQDGQGKMVALTDVAEIVSSQSASHLERYNREPATWLRITVAPGADMKEVRDRCRQLVADQLPNPSTGDTYRALLWSEDPAAPPETLVGR